MNDACSTCARLFNPESSLNDEKQVLVGRELPCCGRCICMRCLNHNKRYETYCPYCQITTQPSLLPQGLRDPPSYSSLEEKHEPPIATTATLSMSDDRPPAYSKHSSTRKLAAKIANDVLHFVSPNDSMRGLALAYDVPIDALRKTNNIYADHLLQARRTVLIPGEFYKGGVSLSPRPPEGEEEEARKHKVRRWMVACKVAEYDIALLYLRQQDWDLDAAVVAYLDDERWEREHPLQARKQDGGKMAKKSTDKVGMRRFVGSTV